MELRSSKRRKIQHKPAIFYEKTGDHRQLYNMSFSIQCSQDSSFFFDSFSNFHKSNSSLRSLSYCYPMDIEEDKTLQTFSTSAVNSQKLDLISPFPFNSLPRELQVIIFSNLEKEEKLNIRLVCKDFSALLDRHLFNMIVTPAPSQTNKQEITILSKEEIKSLISNLSNCGEYVFGFNFSKFSKIHTTPLHHLPSNIKMLDLSGHKNVTDSAIRSFPATIIHLNIAKCVRITDEGLTKLPPNLITLNISCCMKITSSGIKVLPLTIKSLDISRTEIGNDGLKCLPANLESLNVSGCTRISDDGLRSLPKQLKHLRMESLLVSDGGMSYLPGSMYNLELTENEVSWKGLQFLPDTIIQLNLGFRCLPKEVFRYLPPRLEQLHLPFCGIDDESLASLPSSINLLDVSFSNIGDEGLKRLPPKLKTLNVSGCFNLTGRGFQNLSSSIERVVFQYNHLSAEEIALLPLNIKFSINSAQQLTVSEQAP